jgi:hypothetical protein
MRNKAGATRRWENEKSFGRYFNWVGKRLFISPLYFLLLLLAKLEITCGLRMSEENL